eukprot:1143638-Pelagomonas_calceolata.AAC.3
MLLALFYSTAVFASPQHQACQQDTCTIVGMEAALSALISRTEDSNSCFSFYHIQQLTRRRSTIRRGRVA